MQIVYGSDGTNYRIISKSSGLSDKAVENLLDDYMNYDFVSNSDMYSSSSQEPETITFVTSNLNNTLDGNYMIVSKAGHNATLSTPSYYYHALIEDKDDAFYKDQFFEIFNYQFITDKEINGHKHLDINNYPFSHSTYNKIKLKDDQIIAILASFMNNENNGKRTKIIVDASGDGYNRRAREILASIYRYLPYDLRKRHGFISYCKDEKKVAARISFVLFNKDELKSIDDSYIQLDKIDLKTLSVDKKYLDYATYLVSELDDKQRDEHFMKLSQLIYKGRLRIDDCVTYYTYHKEWSEGDQKKLLPTWINYIDRASLQGGPLYTMMLDIIRNKVDNDYYNDYLFDHVLELYNEDLSHLTHNGLKAIRFADCVGLTIDAKRFEEWYFKQFDKKVQRLKKSAEIRDLYQSEIKSLQEAQVLTTQLNQLTVNIINSLKYKLQKFNQEIQSEIDLEIENIGQKFALNAHLNCNDMLDFIEAVHHDIQFPENEAIFNQNVEEWVEDHFPRKSQDCEEIEDFMHFLEKTKPYLEEDKYDFIYRFLDKSLKRLQDKIKDETYQIASFKEVLEVYQRIMKHLDKGSLYLDSVIKITIGHVSFNKPVNEIKDLLEFILVGNDTHIDDEMLSTLLSNELVNDRHFRYLLRCTTKITYIKKIIDYYFITHHHLGGNYLYKVINEEKSDLMPDLIKYYKDNDNEEIQLFISIATKKKRKGLFKK